MTKHEREKAKHQIARIIGQLNIMETWLNQGMKCIDDGNHNEANTLLDCAWDKAKEVRDQLDSVL